MELNKESKLFYRFLQHYDCIQAYFQSVKKNNKDFENWSYINILNELIQEFGILKIISQPFCWQYACDHTSNIFWWQNQFKKNDKWFILNGIWMDLNGYKRWRTYNHDNLLSINAVEEELNSQTYKQWKKLVTN